MGKTTKSDSESTADKKYYSVRLSIVIITSSVMITVNCADGFIMKSRQVSTFFDGISYKLLTVIGTANSDSN